MTLPCPPARVLTLLLLTLLGAGCNSTPTIAREEAFGPSQVRLHPTFSQIKDWTGDGKVDGVEAVVELLDSFGEPTRGSGTLVFELSEYRSHDPQPAARRVADPFLEKLDTREAQQAKWNAALRSYTFQLPLPKIDKTNTFVLDVSFEPLGGTTRPGGGRLFDRLLLEPPSDLKKPDKGVKRGGSKKPSDPK